MAWRPRFSGHFDASAWVLYTQGVGGSKPSCPTQFPKSASDGPFLVATRPCVRYACAVSVPTYTSTATRARYASNGSHRLADRHDLRPAVGPLVWEQLAPSPAHLSCGGYVTIIPNGNGQDAGGDGSLRPDAPPLKAGRPLENQGVPGRTPCQGPWCSENHRPAPTPTTTIERAEEAWASLWSAISPADADSCPLGADVGRYELRQHAGFIFHPPRPV